MTPTIKVRSEFKINMIKTVRFLQGTLLKETEKSLRDVYGMEYFKNLKQKLEDIQKIMDKNREKV